MAIPNAHPSVPDAALQRERRRADDAERELKRLRGGLEAGQIGLWDWNLRTDEVYFSPEWKAQLGCTDDEIANQFPEWQSRLHPDDRDSTLHTVRAFVENPWPTYVAEFRLRHKDGSYRWILARASIARDSHGRARRMLGSHVDITDKKRAEQELAEREEQLRLAVRAADLGTWHWNLRTGDLVLSERCLAMFGIRPDTVMSFERFLEALHVDDRRRVDDAVQRAIRDGAEYDIEYRTVWPDATVHWAAAKGRAFCDGAGKPVRMEGVALDITRQKQFEQELRQAQKLEAIGQLASGVAHDFNNVLTVILGHASLLMARSPQNQNTDESLKAIVNAADHAASLVAQLLAFGRRQVMQPRDLDLNDAAREGIAMLRRILGERIALSLELSPKPAIVHADPGMITQILLNLAVNARDAMPRGGQLSIRTTIERLTVAGAARISEACPGTWACLSVADTGTGISADALPHIFEPFFTTKDIGEGSGLGLSTVYGIIKQHGGFIGVDTRQGQGTTFTAFLPFHDAPIVQESAQPIDAAPHGEGEWILLVEDDDAVRALLTTALEQHGYKVIAAEDGATALRAWEQNRDKIALLLTDVVLPGELNGAELFERLRAQQPDLKALLSSGHGAGVVPGHVLACPGVAFVQKPCSPEHLLRVIRQSLVGAIASA